MQVPWLPELFQQSGDYAFLDTCFLKKPFGVTSGEMTHEDLEAYKYTFGREYKRSRDLRGGRWSWTLN